MSAMQLFTCSEFIILKHNISVPVLLLNILRKKKTAGIFVLILLAAGTFTLSGIPISNLVRGQTNGNDTSEIQATTSIESDQLQRRQEGQKEQQAQEQRPNHPPRANAGSDKKVQEGANVVLDARRSSDPDSGDILTYIWRQSSGPAVTIENSTTSRLLFAAPEVVKDTIFAFTLTVTDSRGDRNTDSVKVSVRNMEPNFDTTDDTSNNNRPTQSNANSNTNPNSNSSPTGATTASNPTSLENTTSQALSNAQNSIRNNGSRAVTPNPNETQLSKAAVFTPQAISTAVSAVQADNIVNTRTAYDIIFRTASAGAIKTVEMTFPPGTNIGSATMLEVSGIGQGGTSPNGQTLVYTVANPVNVPVNVFLRFEVWKILNPPTPGTYTVQVVTRDANGNEIDSGTSATYQIKQIATNDIADNAILSTKIGDGQVGSADIAGNSITGAKILDGQVGTVDIANDAITTQKIKDGDIGTGDIGFTAVTRDRINLNAIDSPRIIDGEVGTVDLADNSVASSKIPTDAVTADEIEGVSKLIFATCESAGDVWPLLGSIEDVICSVPGASVGDTVLATWNHDLSVVDLELKAATVFADDAVSVTFQNEKNGLVSEAPIIGLIVFHS